MTPRQIVLITVAAVGLIMLVLELIRRRMMRENYSLLWIAVSVALLSVPWLYDVYVVMANFVGIKDPNSFFFFIAIMGLFLLCLQFSLAISTAYYQRKTLVQQMAMLEHRVRQLEAEGRRTLLPRRRPSRPRRASRRGLGMARRARDVQIAGRGAGQPGGPSERAASRG